jgi:colanic acid biosynthesis glycosyl transferase WcaI
VLLGDGSQRQSLETLAGQAPNVEFRNLVDEASYPNVLAAADVLLVNERATIVDMSLPGKLTSYFAAARPVVAAVPSNGATAREVTQAGAGIVVPAEDPNALVEAIRLLDRQPELGLRLGAAGAAYAEAELSPAACLARATDLVLAIIDGAAASTRQPRAGPQPNGA